MSSSRQRQADDDDFFFLQCMKESVEARSGTWYSKYLWVVWLIGPFISAVLVLMLSYLPDDHLRAVYVTLIVFDVVHMAHFLTEFYAVRCFC